MEIPGVRLLCLEQLDRSLEDHTRDFFDLACLTDFPDRALSAFYYAGLSERCKARLPANGPREDFAAFVEWVLEQNGSPFTVCPAEEEISSPTPDPETSQPSPRCTELETAAAAEPEPIADREEELESATDQVCEPATPCVVGRLVEIEGVEERPAHTPATEGELHAVSGKYTEKLMDLIDWFGEVIPDPSVPFLLSLFGHVPFLVLLID